MIHTVMAGYRGELEAARARAELLADKLSERERQLAERNAEIARLKEEKRARRDGRVLATTWEERAREDRSRRRWQLGLVAAGGVVAAALAGFLVVRARMHRVAIQNDEAACASTAESCVDAGLALERSGEDERAVALYTRACDGGSLRGCDFLGNANRNGFGGLRVDHARALALHRRACDGGVPSACSNVGWHYLNGLGVAPDHPKAFDLFQGACERGAAIGCNNVGWMYEKGTAEVQDAERATSFYERACQGGYDRGCSNLRRIRSGGAPPE